MKKIMVLVLFLYAFGAFSQELQKDIAVHDPVMIKQQDTYYVFATGKGIAVWSSKDKINWKREQPVFAHGPAWAVDTVKGFKDFIWAPDVHFTKGQYYLYYCVSMFGKNTSAIGVATNQTLDPLSSDFKWVDHGMLLQSVPGRDNWNAIDPNLVLDNRKQPWLTFGSFWEGIKLVKLNSDLLRVTPAALEDMPTIARQRRSEQSSSGEEEEIRTNAIEAPFIFKKSKYYYLFASIGFCCRGSKSTYRMIVGRSRNVGGPYLDQSGVDMAKGGGTLVLKGDAQWYGLGHNSAYTFDGVDYLVFHAYDANDHARPKLRMEKLDWINGWPKVALVVN